MSDSPRAGRPAEPADLANIPRLMTAYYALRPDPAVPAQRVAFGTSGHRGSALDVAFNEAHILAVTQAICVLSSGAGDRRAAVPRDRHPRALGAGVRERARGAGGERSDRPTIDDQAGYTPTPAVSHAILTHNRGRTTGLADGIVVTPSHNPPEDGGFKYNPPTGGPADAHVTGWIQEKANALLAADLEGVKRMPFERARRAATTRATTIWVRTWMTCPR